MFSRGLKCGGSAEQGRDGLEVIFATVVPFSSSKDFEGTVTIGPVSSLERLLEGTLRSLTKGPLPQNEKGPGGKVEWKVIWACGAPVV
jgi:hypothetical protein